MKRGDIETGHSLSNFPSPKLIDGNAFGLGMSTNVGKAASTLLAKHVRTLEVLHSLQQENTRLRREGQGKSTEQEAQKRIADAVAVAVAGPNQLAEELQSQIEESRKRIGDLEQELASATEDSTKILTQTGSRNEQLREANDKLRTRCSDLESETRRCTGLVSRQMDLESKLRESAAALALEEERANDLHRQLLQRESASRALQLSLKERDAKLTKMEAADEAFRSSTDKYKARVADLERQVTNLQKCANTSEKEREALDARLKQALQDGDRARKEAAIISGKEQELRARMTEEVARADVLDARLVQEQKRLHRLREDGKQALEEEARKVDGILFQHALERGELLARIDSLSREVLALREQMNSSKSHFGKYVEAKTENTQLKEEIEGLREIIAVPRPPNRVMHGNSGSYMGSSSGNKGVTVDRLRHSISVARSHKTGAAPSRHSSVVVGGSGAGTGTVAGKSVHVRRHSIGGADGSGWVTTKTNFGVNHESSIPLRDSGRGEEAMRQRVTRAQQVF